MKQAFPLPPRALAGEGIMTVGQFCVPAMAHADAASLSRHCFGTISANVNKVKKANKDLVLLRN